MPDTLPNRMRALLLERHDEDVAEAIRGLKVVERPTPTPGRGQVLVKIEATPCNPSDLVFLQGRHREIKTLPSVPGWEGAGRVVAAGRGWLPRWLRGRRVACALQGDRDGAWAEFFVAGARDCLPLAPRIPIEQAACLIINPMTAAALLDIARRRHRAAVHTAGASQLGRMLLVMAGQVDYPILHVVRRDAQRELLQSLGAKHVLNSSDDGFLDQLQSACERLGATIAFDAVGGDMTGALVRAMPPGSTVCVYGALSGKPCADIDPVDLLYRNKAVTGFFLGRWLRSRGLIGVLRTASRIQRLVAARRIGTTIQRRLSLEEAPDGLLQYIDRMTEGKVLITPHSQRSDALV